MIELVKGLKRTMKERLIGVEEAARLIGCTSRNLYRWLDGEITPTVKMQNAIRLGMRKMQRMFPTEDEGRMGEALLQVLKGFLSPGLKVKDEEKAVRNLVRLDKDDQLNVFQSGWITDEDEAIEFLKKYGIEVVKK